jgi:hypothetical protein
VSTGLASVEGLEQVKATLTEFFVDAIADAEAERNILVSLYYGMGLSSATDAAVDKTVDNLEQFLLDLGVPFEEE